MSQTIPMHIIAHIRSDFPTKFGIPRQSGLADVPARIVFEPEYRNADALRGIEGFSHLWLIWQFSEAVRDGKFVGLALDETNEDDRTAERIAAWVETLKKEGL